LIERVEAQVDHGAGAEDYFRALQTINPLHRAVVNMRHTLQQAREMVPDDRDLIVFRDRADELALSTELLHADATHGLQYAMAREAEEQSRTSMRMARSAHRLNLLVALFLPLATVSAVLGMNLRSGMEDASPLLMALVVLAGLLGGLGLWSGIRAMDRPRDHRDAAVAASAPGPVRAEAVLPRPARQPQPPRTKAGKRR
jgi:hypothetical protein